MALKEWMGARHRGLFIRSYLVLAGGLLIVAVLLDFGFGALESRSSAQTISPWLESTFRMMESRLAAAPAEDRPALAHALSHETGAAVSLLDASDIAGAAPSEGAVRTLVDESGQTFYLWNSRALHGAIRMGPFDPPRESALARFLPLVFYASILALVGLWLRPLFRDLRILTVAAQKFATDYREPLDTARQTTQLTSLARNLDDMSARVSQLIQTQKEMTAALSHEMRTPLARVRFAMAVLEGQVDPGAHSQLRAVNADVQQIDDLISDVLDYARLDHPGLRMNLESVPVEPWLHQIVISSPPHERTLQTTLQPDLLTVRMEPRLMELALKNLLANALRHAKERVSVHFAREDDLYRLTVDDDGEGIPDADRASVFRAFTRLDTSRNRDTGGFGLGLAIVARIAALHRGRAVADASASLGGARFSVEWPAT